MATPFRSAVGWTALERAAKLFGAWDAAEPGKGYAEKAAEWRGKLEELGTEAPRHEGAREGDAATAGNEDSGKP